MDPIRYADASDFKHDYTAIPYVSHHKLVGAHDASFFAQLSNGKTLITCHYWLLVGIPILGYNKPTI